MKIKEFFLHKFPSKASFRHRIHNYVKRADARGSADIMLKECAVIIPTITNIVNLS